MKLYNPFKRIRDLQEINEFLRAELKSEEAVNIAWGNANIRLRREAKDHAQAIEAFMVEREELKVAAEASEFAGIRTAQIIARIAGSIADENDDLADQLDEQTGEMLEAIAFVKQVEAALQAVGIGVSERPDGSLHVHVNEDLAEAALQRGDVTVYGSAPSTAGNQQAA